MTRKTGCGTHLPAWAYGFAVIAQAIYWTACASVQEVPGPVESHYVDVRHEQGEKHDGSKSPPADNTAQTTRDFEHRGLARSRELDSCDIQRPDFGQDSAVAAIVGCVTGPDGAIRRTEPNTVVYVGERVEFAVVARNPVYLQALQVQEGRVSKLWPVTGSGESLALEPMRTYRIPGQGTDFILDDETGVFKVLFILSQKPLHESDPGLGAISQKAYRSGTSLAVADTAPLAERGLVLHQKSERLLAPDAAGVGTIEFRFDHRKGRGAK